MKEQHFTVATPSDFSPVIESILQTLPEATDTASLITLSGDLGAGKTTFTQQLALQLGITEPVVSPTFGIMKIYELSDHASFDQLIHIDAYRIEDISEVGPLRLAEVFSTARTLVCIEWPEHIAEILPKQQTSIAIMIGLDEERQVTVIQPEH